MERKNLLTAARRALIQQLETVSPENGYWTAAGGNVRSGWYNEIVESDKTGYPLIVVQRNDARSPEPCPGAMKLFPGFHVIGAVSSSMDEYEDALDDLEEDLVRCLAPAHGLFLPWLPRGAPGISVGAARRIPPGNGLKAATVVIPVYLTTFIETIDYR
ncbi:hypothetical protein LF844_09875 [Metapseudomonas lalkuanensis]|uniref:hypothetical protein n=1 Tax=Metapseudomonas lalkuanensis TaxID=2604832 RepID=UPI001CF5A868|nr:hypothetical protein [Pseudomonas lalkuanensis]UCP00097.1 hypothetical protein LF844_09875 [Pseudomonas lalkuanensis]